VVAVLDARRLDQQVDAKQRTRTEQHAFAAALRFDERPRRDGPAASYTSRMRPAVVSTDAIGFKS
jgi:hypothetical protein